MREYIVPAVDEVTARESLSDAVFENAEQYPDTVSFRRKTDGGWVDVTAKEFAAQVTDVAKGLIASGVAKDDRVAVLSRTRFEWTVIDYAIASVGATTVPIYQTSSVEQINWILSDSGAVAVVVESDKHRAAWMRCASSSPTCGGLADRADRPSVTPAIDHLVAQGASCPPRSSPTGARRWARTTWPR